MGKSRLAKEISQKLDLKWLDVSAIAKKNDFISGQDKVLDCPILDEDAVSYQ